MREKSDLQRMLLEIQDDEAVDPGKATHLSQDQIEDLVTRRKAQNKTQDTSPAMRGNPNP